MRFPYYYLSIVFALLACSEQGEVPAPEPLPEPEAGSRLIAWNVKPNTLQGTRALVEDDEALQQACTPTPAGAGKAIGIWSAYVLDGTETRNVLGNPDGDVGLTYREDTEWDNYRGWTYGETAAEWVQGAKYTFNAYYPMHAVDEISSSDTSTFVVDYNTEQFQEDLMMAYAYADTEATTFQPGQPVELNMLHVLAALRFNFLFMNADGSTYEDSDALTACWLENTIHGTGLATTGVLAFGTIDASGTMQGEAINWYHEDHPEPSTETAIRKIYPWQDTNGGVAFSSTTTTYTAATAYTTNSDNLQQYAGNEGWLLVLPQETDGTTQLCFCLATTGDLVHRIDLPATTYAPGRRYTYNIQFGQTGVTLTLKIADWNELKSSEDIPM